MQNTRDYSEWYSRYIEDDLTKPEKVVFEKYLDENPEEKAVVERLQSLRSTLATFSPAPVSDDFETVLRARIQMEKKIGHGALSAFIQKWRSPVLGFASAIVLFIALNVFTGLQPDNTTGESKPISRQVLQNTQTPASNVQYSLDQFNSHTVFPTDIAVLSFGQIVSNGLSEQRQTAVVDSSSMNGQKPPVTVHANVQLSY